jgi:signal transduction histidine kinase/CheY-like chemotaxis protein
MILHFIRKRLGRTILTVLAVSVALVMVAEMYLRVSRGFRDRIEMMTLFGNEFAASIYAGIRHPMSIGDSAAVRKQIQDIKDKMSGVEIFICDFDREIVFGTLENSIKTDIGKSLHNKELMEALRKVSVTGVDPGKAFEEEDKGKRYLVTIHPILNEPDCFHCHGSSRKVLGSMVIKMSTEQVYAAIASGRNRSIMITVFGICVLLVLTYVVLKKLVIRPIENLADKAKRFAEGDMSVKVDVRTEDEAGELGNAFNYMVNKISSFSRELEVQVARRTMLLREKTLLLERANRELRELDRLKSSFLANMSHELRTPMNSIIGYTELLQDGVDGPVNEEQAKSLQKVESNARHLLQLINDILDMSRIESGKLELELRELNLKDVVESVIAGLKPALSKKSLVLRQHFAEDLPHIYADEDKVKQILINLLSNAIKFTDEGTIAITAQPTDRGIRPGEPALFIEVCVEDSGIGIKEEDIVKLFDKFSQLDISTIRRYEGTGLGLSIARGLVVLHKGVIWVTSKYGKGSRFCFTLPVRKDVLEKPAEPVIEALMAEGLAEYFSKPVETFLKEPKYAGKAIKCWEYVHCGQTSCPAYGSKEKRCWLVLGTHCKGTKVAAFPEKVDFCKGCEIIERLILESDEFSDLEAPDNRGEPSGKSVIVIDDNPEAVDIIRKYLGRDYQVVGILHGEDAVETAKKIKPVAITLDIMMPVKNGWEVLQDLKKDPETQDIPVIILSIMDDKQLGFSLGAAEYMLKPVVKEVLLRKLKNLERISPIKNILIVDNEPDTVAVIAEVLAEAGYKVSRAYNSEDAVKSLKNYIPDLIVLDLTIPQVAGYDVIEYIETQEKARNIPLLVITPKDLTQKEVDDLNGRIKGIVNKRTLSKEEFLSEIRNAIIKIDSA